VISDRPPVSVSAEDASVVSAAEAFAAKPVIDKRLPSTRMDFMKPHLPFFEL
jgi:hypothetical protein